MKFRIFPWIGEANPLQCKIRPTKKCHTQLTQATHDEHKQSNQPCNNSNKKCNLTTHNTPYSICPRLRLNAMELVRPQPVGNVPLFRYISPSTYFKSQYEHQGILEWLKVVILCNRWQPGCFYKPSWKPTPQLVHSLHDTIQLLYKVCWNKTIYIYWWCQKEVPNLQLLSIFNCRLLSTIAHQWVVRERTGVYERGATTERTFRTKHVYMDVTFFINITTSLIDCLIAYETFRYDFQANVYIVTK